MLVHDEKVTDSACTHLTEKSLAAAGAYGAILPCGRGQRVRLRPRNLSRARSEALRHFGRRIVDVDDLADIACGD
jgi:hypothetical protein